MCEEGLQSPCAHRRTAPAAPAGRAAAVRSSAAALELGCGDGLLRLLRLLIRAQLIQTFCNIAIYQWGHSTDPYD
jgi:hypothetical protein